MTRHTMLDVKAVEEALSLTEHVWAAEQHLRLLHKRMQQQQQYAQKPQQQQQCIDGEEENEEYKQPRISARFQNGAEHTTLLSPAFIVYLRQLLPLLSPSHPLLTTGVRLLFELVRSDIESLRLLLKDPSTVARAAHNPTVAAPVAAAAAQSVEGAATKRLIAPNAAACGSALNSSFVATNAGADPLPPSAPPAAAASASSSTAPACAAVASTVTATTAASSDVGAAASSDVGAAACTAVQWRNFVTLPIISPVPFCINSSSNSSNSSTPASSLFCADSPSAVHSEGGVSCCCCCCSSTTHSCRCLRAILQRTMLYRVNTNSHLAAFSFPHDRITKQSDIDIRDKDSNRLHSSKDSNRLHSSKDSSRHHNSKDGMRDDSSKYSNRHNSCTCESCMCNCGISVARERSSLLSTRRKLFSFVDICYSLTSALNLAINPPSSISFVATTTAAGAAASEARGAAGAAAAEATGAAYAATETAGAAAAARTGAFRSSLDAAATAAALVGGEGGGRGTPPSVLLPGMSLSLAVQLVRAAAALLASLLDMPAYHLLSMANNMAAAPAESAVDCLAPQQAVACSSTSSTEEDSLLGFADSGKDGNKQCNGSLRGNDVRSRSSKKNKPSSSKEESAPNASSYTSSSSSGTHRCTSCTSNNSSSSNSGCSIRISGSSSSSGGGDSGIRPLSSGSQVYQQADISMASWSAGWGAVLRLCEACCRMFGAAVEVEMFWVWRSSSSSSRRRKGPSQQSLISIFCEGSKSPVPKGRLVLHQRQQHQQEEEEQLRNESTGSVALPPQTTSQKVCKNTFCGAKIREAETAAVTASFEEEALRQPLLWCLLLMAGCGHAAQWLHGWGKWQQQVRHMREQLRQEQETQITRHRHHILQLLFEQPAFPVRNDLQLCYGSDVNRKAKEEEERRSNKEEEGSVLPLVFSRLSAAAGTAVAWLFTVEDPRQQQTLRFEELLKRPRRLVRQQLKYLQRQLKQQQHLLDQQQHQLNQQQQQHHQLNQQQQQQQQQHLMHHQQQQQQLMRHQQQQLYQEEPQQLQLFSGGNTVAWVKLQSCASEGASAGSVIPKEAGSPAQCTAAEMSLCKQQGLNSPRNVHAPEEKQYQGSFGCRDDALTRGKERERKRRHQGQQQQEQSAAAVVRACLLKILWPLKYNPCFEAALTRTASFYMGKCNHVLCECVSSYIFCAANRERLPQLGLLQLLPALCVRMAFYLKTYQALSRETVSGVTTPDLRLTVSAGTAVAPAAAPATDALSSSDSRIRLTDTSDSAAAAGPRNFQAVLVLLELLLHHESQQRQLNVFPLEVLMSIRQMRHTGENLRLERQQQVHEEVPEQQQQSTSVLQPVNTDKQLYMLLRYILWEEAESTCLVRQWQMVCSPTTALLQLRDDPLHVQRDALLCFGTQVMLRLEKLFAAAFLLLQSMQMSIHALKRSVLTSFAPSSGHLANSGAVFADVTPGTAAVTPPVVAGAPAANGPTLPPTAAAPASTASAEDEEISYSTSAERGKRAPTLQQHQASAEGAVDAGVSFRPSAPGHHPTACCCVSEIHTCSGTPSVACLLRVGFVEAAPTAAVEQQEQLQHFLDLTLLLQRTLMHQDKELWGGLLLVAQQLPAQFEHVFLSNTLSLLQQEQHLWSLLQHQQQQLLAVLHTHQLCTVVHPSHAAQLPLFRTHHMPSFTCDCRQNGYPAAFSSSTFSHCSLCNCAKYSSLPSSCSFSSCPLSSPSYSLSSSSVASACDSASPLSEVSRPCVLLGSHSSGEALEKGSSNAVYRHSPEKEECGVPDVLLKRVYFYIWYLDNTLRKQQRQCLLSLLPFVHQQQRQQISSDDAVLLDSSDLPGSTFFVSLFVAYRGLHDLSALLARIRAWQQEQEDYEQQQQHQAEPMQSWLHISQQKHDNTKEVGDQLVKASEECDVCLSQSTEETYSEGQSSSCSDSEDYNEDAKRRQRVNVSCSGGGGGDEMGESSSSSSACKRLHVFGCLESSNTSQGRLSPQRHTRKHFHSQQKDPGFLPSLSERQHRVRSAAFLLSPIILQMFASIPVTALPAQLPSLADMLLQLLLDAGSALAATRAVLVQRQQQQEAQRLTSTYLDKEGSSHTTRGRKRRKAAQNSVARSTTEDNVDGASYEGAESLCTTTKRKAPPSAGDGRNGKNLAVMTEDISPGSVTAGHRSLCNNSATRTCTLACSNNSYISDTSTPATSSSSSRSGDASAENLMEEGARNSSATGPKHGNSSSHTKSSSNINSSSSSGKSSLRSSLNAADQDTGGCSGEMKMSGDQVAYVDGFLNGNTVMRGEDLHASQISTDEKQNSTSLLSREGLYEVPGGGESREEHASTFACHVDSRIDLEENNICVLMENVAVYCLVLSYFTAGFLELENPIRRSQQLQQQIEALLPRLLPFWVRAVGALLEQRQLFISLGICSEFLSTKLTENTSTLRFSQLFNANLRKDIGTCGLTTSRSKKFRSQSHTTDVDMENVVGDWKKGGDAVMALAAGAEQKQHHTLRLHQLWQHSEACLAISLASLSLVFRAWRIPSYSTSSSLSRGSMLWGGDIATDYRARVETADSSSITTVQQQEQELLHFLQNVAVGFLPVPTVGRRSCGSDIAALGACTTSESGALEQLVSSEGAEGSTKGIKSCSHQQKKTDITANTSVSKGHRGAGCTIVSNERGAPGSTGHSSESLSHDFTVWRGLWRQGQSMKDSRSLLLGVRAGLLFLLLSEGNETCLSSSQQMQQQQQLRHWHCLHKTPPPSKAAEQIAFAVIDCLNYCVVSKRNVRMSSKRGPFGCCSEQECLCTAAEVCHIFNGISSSPSTVEFAERSARKAIGEGDSHSSSVCSCKTFPSLCERQHKRCELCSSVETSQDSEKEESMRQRIGWILWDAEVLPYVSLLVRHLPISVLDSQAAVGFCDSVEGVTGTRLLERDECTSEEAHTRYRGNRSSCYAQLRWQCQRAMGTLASWVVSDSVGRSMWTPIDMREQRKHQQRLQQMGVFEIHCLQPYVLTRIQLELRDARVHLLSLPRWQDSADLAETAIVQRRRLDSAEVPTVIEKGKRRSQREPAAQATSRPCADTKEGLARCKVAVYADTQSLPLHGEDAFLEEPDVCIRHNGGTAGENNVVINTADMASAGSIFKQMRLLLRFLWMQPSQGYLSLEYCCSTPTDAIAVAAAAPVLTSVCICRGDIQMPDGVGGGEPMEAKKKQKKKKRHKKRTQVRDGVLLLQLRRRLEPLRIPQRLLLQEIWQCLQAVLAWVGSREALTKRTRPRQLSEHDNGAGRTHKTYTTGHSVRAFVAAAGAAAAVVVESMQALVVLSASSAAAREALTELLQEQHRHWELVEPSVQQQQQEPEQKQVQQRLEDNTHQQPQSQHPHTLELQQVPAHEGKVMNSQQHTREKRKRMESVTAIAVTQPRECKQVAGYAEGMEPRCLPRAATATVLRQLQEWSVNPITPLSHISAAAQHLGDLLWLAAGVQAAFGITPEATTLIESRKTATTAPASSSCAAADVCIASSGAPSTYNFLTSKKEAENTTQKGDASEHEWVGLLHPQAVTQTALVHCPLCSRTADDIANVLVGLVCYTVSAISVAEKECAAPVFGADCGRELHLTSISSEAVGKSATADVHVLSAGIIDGRSSMEWTTVDTTVCDRNSAEATVAQREAVEAGADTLVSQHLWLLLKCVRVAFEQTVLERKEKWEDKELTTSGESFAYGGGVATQSPTTDTGYADVPGNNEISSRPKAAPVASAPAAASLLLRYNEISKQPGPSSVKRKRRNCHCAEKTSDSIRETHSLSSSCSRVLRQVQCLFSCLTRLIEHIGVWEARQEWVQQQGARQKKCSSNIRVPPEVAAWTEQQSVHTVQRKEASGSTTETNKKTILGMDDRGHGTACGATLMSSEHSSAQPQLQMLLNIVATLAASLRVHLHLPLLLWFLWRCLLAGRPVYYSRGDGSLIPQHKRQEKGGKQHQQQGIQLPHQEETQQKETTQNLWQEQQQDKEMKRGCAAEGHSTDFRCRRHGYLTHKEHVFLTALIVRHGLTIVLWHIRRACSSSSVAEMKNRLKSHQPLQQQEENSSKRQQHTLPQSASQVLKLLGGGMVGKERSAEHTLLLAEASAGSHLTTGGQTTAAADNVNNREGPPNEAVASLVFPPKSIPFSEDFTEEAVLRSLEILLAEIWERHRGTSWRCTLAGDGVRKLRLFDPASSYVSACTSQCCGGDGGGATYGEAEKMPRFFGTEVASAESAWSIALTDVVLGGVQEVVRWYCSQWAATVRTRRLQMREQHLVEHPEPPGEVKVLRQPSRQAEHGVHEQVDRQLLRESTEKQHKDDGKQQQEAQTQQQQQRDSSRKWVALVGLRLITILVNIDEIYILQALNQSSTASESQRSPWPQRRASTAGFPSEDVQDITATHSEALASASRSKNATSGSHTSYHESINCPRARYEAVAVERLLLLLPLAADVCEDKGSRGLHPFSFAAASTAWAWQELLGQQLPARLLLEVVLTLSRFLDTIRQQNSTAAGCCRGRITSLAVGRALLLLLHQRTNVMGCLLRGTLQVKARKATVQQQLLRALCSLLQRLQQECKGAFSLLAGGGPDTRIESATSKAQRHVLCAWLSVCVGRASCLLSGMLSLVATHGQRKKAKRQHERLPVESSSHPAMQDVVAGRGALGDVALLLARGATSAMEALCCAPREPGGSWWRSSVGGKYMTLEHLPCQAAMQLHALLLVLPLNPQLQQLYLPLLTELLVRLLHVALHPDLVSSRRRYAALLRQNIEEIAAWRSSARTYASVKRSCQWLLLLLAAETLGVLRHLRLLSVSSTASSLHIAKPPPQMGAAPGLGADAPEPLRSQSQIKRYFSPWGAECQTKAYHLQRRKERYNAVAAAEFVKALLPILKSTFEGAGTKDVDDEALAHVCASLRQPVAREELIEAVKAFEKYGKFKGKV